MALGQQLKSHYISGKHTPFLVDSDTLRNYLRVAIDSAAFGVTKCPMNGAGIQGPVWLPLIGAPNLRVPPLSPKHVTSQQDTPRGTDKVH